MSCRFALLGGALERARTTLQDPRARWRAVFWATLGAAFLLRAWFATTIPLSGDEAYHWEWSRHLAAGYYDHPGLGAYLIAASTWILGDTELAVRLPALLAMSAVACAARAFALRISLRLGVDEQASERAAASTGLLVLAVPVFAFFAVFASGDAPLFLAWMLALGSGWRALETGRWRWWLALGASAGAGLQSKFLFLPFLPGFALFLLVSPLRRRWLLRPQPYAALGLALALWAPFLAWNAAHDWATFRFNFASRHDSLAHGRAFLELLASQALVPSPGVTLVALLACARILVKRSAATAAELLLALLWAVPLAGYTAASLRGTEVGAHWPATAWLGALVLVPAWIERTRARAPGRARGLVLATLGLAAAATLAAHAVLALPREWLAALPLRHPTRAGQLEASRVSELYGWRELGRHVAEVRERMLLAQEPRRGVFVLAAQYGVAAQVAFYTPGRPPAYLWEPPRRHGQSYRTWQHFDELRGQDALFVTKSAKRVAPSVAELGEHFARVHEPERLAIVAGGREVRAFHLVRCEGFDGSPPSFP